MSENKCDECVWWVKSKNWDYCLKERIFYPVGCKMMITKDDLEIERLEEFKEWLKDYRTWDEEKKERWIYERWNGES